jgi:protoporphyrinogen oxidase
MKKKAVIVGSGISGLSISKMLRNDFEVTVLEKAAEPGGLIKCKRISGNLFHLVGGHVFNTRNARVLNWFWNQFDRDAEFISAKRNAKILLNGQLLGYPIENYIYKLPPATIQSIVGELLQIAAGGTDGKPAINFETFLKQKFGNTLYELYFGPYNAKLWNRDLQSIPLAWLDGKLPMPDIRSILVSNIEKKEETEMVHAQFYYPKRNGSQFIVDRLAEGTKVQCATAVTSIRFENEQVVVNNMYTADFLVYCGDVRKLGNIIQTADEGLQKAMHAVHRLPANGTSNVLCETDEADISWLYLPEKKFAAHRIIYTGNFSDSNNSGSGRKTCVVEFSGNTDRQKMDEELALLPGNLTPLSYNYEPDSYIIHEHDTREKIAALKTALKKYNIYLLGRFAEWEYYNMDKCIESAMALADSLRNPTTQSA